MKLMEHLAPQDPIDVYQPQIDQNYNTARAYFKARRQAVKAFYDKEIGLSIENLLEQMSDEIGEGWLQEVNEGAVAGMALAGAGGGGGVNNAKGNYRYTVSSDVISKYGDSGVRGAFKEYVINNLFGNKIRDMVSEDVAGIINSMFIPFKAVHRSVTTGSDIVITATLDVDNPFPSGLKSFLKITRNTRANLSLDRYTAENINNNEFLKKYLMSGAHGFYINHDIGNSGSGAIRFIGARSSVSEINASFNRRDSHGLKHTWEPEYAKIYSRWVISKELINILGPFNVALITGGGIQWMDDFLSKINFDAEVSIGAIKRSTRDGGTRPTREAFPRLESAFITIGDANKILQRQINTKGKDITVEINLS